MKCTWINCDKDAEHTQNSTSGRAWANLCNEHHSALNDAIDELDVKKLLQSWVRASGGAKKMVESGKILGQV